MKNLLLIALVAAFAFSCGDAGVGFNVGKEFPIAIPVEFSDIPEGIPDFLGKLNPPAFEESIDYSLDAVGTFDGVDNAEVVVNGFAYEITGIEAAQNENIEVEAMTLVFKTDQFTIASIDIGSQFTGNTFNNLSKRDVSNFNAAGLSELLENGGKIIGEVTFDFAEVPTQNFDFEFILYFDVLLKARDL